MMNTKKINQSLNFFPYTFFLILLLMNSCAISPIKIVVSMFEKPDSSDLYITDYKFLEKMYNREFSKYQFQPNDTIAEIGAGHFGFSLSNMCFQDSLTFYVQDINLKYLTEEHLQKGKEHFTKLRGLGPLKGNIYVVQGDTHCSNLPKNAFDKVILRLVYHEFKKPEQNLQDIYQILKPEGYLFVGENIQKKRNKMKKCGLHRTEANLINEIENAGFELDTMICSLKNNNNYKVYRFKKKKI